MVCFTAHLFKFNSTNANNWFNLLCKYYSGVGVNVITDGVHSTKGDISMDFFQNKLIKGETYEIRTERFWAELAAIKCMPLYVNDDVNILRFQQNDSNNLDISNATKSIDSIISSRLSHGGQEVFLRSKYSLGTFDDLVTAFSLIKNTQDITRYYASASDKVIIIVLKDSHTLLLSTDGVSDGTLPIFDIDDGFSLDAFDTGLLIYEFNKKFALWSKEFKESNGDNWNEQIV